MSEGGRLSHLTDTGEVRVVDVSEKKTTKRVAVAECWATLSQECFEALKSEKTPKGDVLATVRIGSIMASKKTSELIPLCHPLPIDAVNCEISYHPPQKVRIEVRVTTTAKTGVEMEAMTGAATGGLILYDMLKAIDKSIILGPTQLLYKEGGKSGTYTFSKSPRESEVKS